MKLTQKAIDRGLAPGRYHDNRGTGLFLLVKPSGRASFVQRIMIGGKRRDIGIGSIRWMTLAEARERAAVTWRKARRGELDAAPRRRKMVAPSLATVADKVIDTRRSSWKAGTRIEQQWRSSLRDHVFPRFGTWGIDAITAGNMVELFGKLQKDGRIALIKTLRVRLEVVFDFAIANGWRADNPARIARGSLPKVKTSRNHHKSVAHGDLPDVIRKVQGFKNPSHAIAFQFIALTAVRISEALGAKWSEIDGETWTIPADRMKAKKAHDVPLSPAAMNVLQEARNLGDCEFVFPSNRGKQITGARIGEMIRELGIDATTHGLRSSFRDWCAETGVEREVAEACLAHAVESQTEAAYLRTNVIARRAPIMAKWGEHISPRKRFPEC